MQATSLVQPCEPFVHNCVPVGTKSTQIIDMTLKLNLVWLDFKDGLLFLIE